MFPLPNGPVHLKQVHTHTHIHTHTHTHTHTDMLPQHPCYTKQTMQHRHRLQHRLPPQWSGRYKEDHLMTRRGTGRLLVGCLTSRQHARVSQGRICSDSFTCCHTEIEVADPTFYLTQSQYTDTGPSSPSVDPVTPGAWQGSHWSANFKSLV